MATVTGGGITTTLNVGTNDANGVAQALADRISAALAAGTLTRTNGGNPPTGAGLLTISTPGVLVADQPAVSSDLIAGGTGSVSVVGAGGPNQFVLGDQENITFFTNGGSGTLVFGDGNDIVGTPTIGGGAFNIATGAGNDTIDAYSGNNTISAGTGANVINTGLTGTFSNNLIFANGTGVGDRIISTGGSGTDTVIGNNGPVFINEATKNLVFNGQGGNGSVTVAGGAGSATVFAGPGGGSIAGGTAGNNVLLGGTGSAPTTLFGGGNNDLLIARGTGATFLIAGAGNETLSGAGSTANNIFAAGNGGNTTIGGGVGNDVIYIGNPGTTTPISGSVVVDGGLGNDIISFTNRGTGGSTESVLINNFRNNASESDRVQLIGFGTNQQSAITSAAASAGSVTLTDGTRINFGTAVALNSSNFA